MQTSVAYLHQTIQECYRLANLLALSPGSGEVSNWPIEEQCPLFALFGRLGVVHQSIGVQLLPSFLMSPEMSASGVHFPSETTYYNRQLCQRESCPIRRAPFDVELWQAVHRIDRKADCVAS